MRKLIFDIGAHNGEDTEFYLRKGFRVVSIEANPILSESLRKRFEVMDSHLIIENQAIADRSGYVDLYVNDNKSDWSSLYKDSSEKGIYSSRKITVRAERLEVLIEKHGMPYFMKCDIEDGDIMVARQLVEVSRVFGRSPDFASFEFCDVEILKCLSKIGYSKFQVINQTYNWMLEAPSPPREGDYVKKSFDAFSSGLFGRELDPKKWIDHNTASRIYDRFNELKTLDPLVCPGWLDIHATRCDV